MNKISEKEKGKENKREEKISQIANQRMQRRKEIHVLL
jgi:hypothetical protein